MATAREVTVYAKTNGVTRQEAREHFLSEAKQRGPKKSVAVYSNGGSISMYKSGEDMFNAIRDQKKSSAQDLLERCGMNFDFSLCGKPALVTKQLTIGGVNVNVHLHTDANMLSSLGEKYNTTFLALFQVFTKTGNVLLPISKEQIDDAGHDWRGEEVFAKDDILNRSVAALRLYNNDQYVHDIATHIAYEETSPDSGKDYYAGIDGAKLHRVWD